MQRDPASYQRFHTSVASLTPHFDRIFGAFLQRVAREHPGMQPLGPWTKRERYDAAASFGELVKNIDHPRRATVAMDRITTWFETAGLGERDVTMVQAALIAEVRAAAGADWSDELQTDWNAMARSVLSSVRTSAAAPLRAAA